MGSRWWIARSNPGAGYAGIASVDAEAFCMARPACDESTEVCRTAKPCTERDAQVAPLQSSGVWALARLT